MDRTRFKGQVMKMNARSVGLITVASSSGIEETLSFLERHVAHRSSLPPEKIHKVGGTAKKPGDVKENHELIRQARELGCTMAEDLK